MICSRPTNSLQRKDAVNHLTPYATVAYFLFQPLLRGVCFVFPSLHLFSYPLPIFFLTAPLAHCTCLSCLPLPLWTSWLHPQSPLPPLCLTWFMWRLVFFQSETVSLTHHSASAWDPKGTMLIEVISGVTWSGCACERARASRYRQIFKNLWF